MSLDDVSPDEMGAHRHDDADGFEQLLEGSAQAREQSPELGSFVDDVRAISAASPAAEVRHIVAMMAEAQLIADKGDPVARPVSNAHGPAPQVSGLPMRRSTQMLKMLLTKVMAPLVAVFTVMGGLAYAQALPTPLQDAVSGAAGVVGIDLPDSDETDGDETDDDVADDDASDDVVDEVGDDVEEDDQGDDDRSGSGNDDDATPPGDDEGENDQGDDHSDSDDDENSGSDDDADDDNSGPGGGSDDDDADDEDEDADEDDDNSGPGGGSDDSDEDDANSDDDA